MHFSPVESGLCNFAISTTRFTATGSHVLLDLMSLVLLSHKPVSYTILLSLITLITGPGWVLRIKMGFKLVFAQNNWVKLVSAVNAAGV